MADYALITAVVIVLTMEDNGIRLRDRVWMDQEP